MSKPASFRPHYRGNHRNLSIVDASKAEQSLQKCSHGDEENDKKNTSLLFCIAVAVMGFLTTTAILLILFYIRRNRVTNTEIGPQLNPFDVPPANMRMSSSRTYQGLRTNDNNAGLVVVVENNNEIMNHNNDIMNHNTYYNFDTMKGETINANANQVEEGLVVVATDVNTNQEEGIVVVATE